jgi:hypothetical protein
LGTGNGDALLTAFSAERSKISSPLDEMTVASITVPSDINRTLILHFNPELEVGGRIQLRLVFSWMAAFAF